MKDTSTIWRGNLQIRKPICLMWDWYCLVWIVLIWNRNLCKNRLITCFPSKSLAFHLHGVRHFWIDSNKSFMVWLNLNNSIHRNNRCLWIDWKCWKVVSHETFDKIVEHLKEASIPLKFVNKFTVKIYLCICENLVDFWFDFSLQ